MKTGIAIGMLLILLTGNGMAQDHLYTQFFNAPNYLNPALNGQFNADLRINMIYRNQWTALNGNLKYYSFSVDYQLPNANSGIGLMLTNGTEGVAFLKKTNLCGIYNYNAEFENATLSFGLQAGITSRGIDSRKLVFADQIDNLSGIIPGAVTAADVAQINTRYYFDAGAGINFVSGNLMAGVAAQHLNQPDESLINTASKLPVRQNAHISYMLDIDRYDDGNDHAIIPSLVVYNQGSSRTFMGGAQYKYKNFNLGIWYKSLGNNNNAISFTILIDLFTKRDTYDKLRLGFSHDVSVSGVSYGKTGGSSESAINYEIELPSRHRPRNQTPKNKCYDFY